MDYTVQEFYRQLAPDYHFIFKDWEATVHKQGEVLDNLIRRHLPNAESVLDCACGIGTQAIGLALQGYHVRATDLSPAAVRRARTEAKNFGVKIFFGDADFRDLARAVDGTFDVVLACDNAVAHLLRNSDLTLAAASMREKLVPGGLLMLSLRDYDQIVQEQAARNAAQHPRHRRRTAHLVPSVGLGGGRAQLRTFALHPQTSRAHAGQLASARRRCARSNATN